MDRKAGYLIGIGVVIIAVLFLVMTASLSGDHTDKHPEIVKKELENPNEVKGVFKNIYVAYKEPVKEHEEVVEESEGSAGEEAEHKAEKAKAEPQEEGVIKMDSSIYSKHTKPIVLFTHLKHIKEYKLGCGECHHDDMGEPLSNLTFNSSVKSCDGCHDKPGRKPKGEELSKEAEISYQAEALHTNCIECHRKHNAETGSTKAPVMCNGCHSK